MDLTKVHSVDFRDIEVGKRIRKDSGNIKELAESLNVSGQLQPIICEHREDKLYLLAGFRRLTAAAYLQGENRSIRDLAPGHVNVILKEDLDPTERLLIEFEENKRRKNFTDAEEAIAISELKVALEGVNERKVSGKEMAKLLGYSKAHVTMALEVASAVQKGGKKELLKASSISGAYKSLQSSRKIEELQLKAATRVRAEGAYTNILCARAEEAITRLPDGSMDFVNFDPPWGIGIDSYDRFEKYGTFDDSASTGIQMARDLIPELYRVLATDSYMVVWFGIQYYQFLVDEMQKAGFTVNPVPHLWIKPNKVGSQNDPTRTTLNCYEPFFEVRKGEPRMHKHAQKNILEYDMPVGIDRIHFAQKSVPLLKDILERYSFGAMNVLDPTFGSGSFLMAAQDLGRNMYGFERDQKNYDNALAWLRRGVANADTK